MGDNMNIGICSDHRGYELKEELINVLKNHGYNITDYGTYSSESVDYPNFAFMLSNGVINKDVTYGIAICGTGIGMSIACNKVKGIRCAKIDNINDAKYAKMHNNANVLAVSASKTLDEILEMINKFNENEFSSDKKHERRIKLIEDYENEH